VGVSYHQVARPVEKRTHGIRVVTMIDYQVVAPFCGLAAEGAQAALQCPQAIKFVFRYSVTTQQHPEFMDFAVFRVIPVFAHAVWVIQSITACNGPALRTSSFLPLCRRQR
jgi:hypothetical protein